MFLAVEDFWKFHSWKIKNKRKKTKKKKCWTKNQMLILLYILDIIVYADKHVLN